jgi:phosphatidate cytidylyltransferase
MLTTRLITAAIGIPLVAGAVWVGDVLLAAVVAVAVAIATLEFANARGVMRSHTAIVSALAAAALPVAAYFGEEYLLGAVVGVIGVMGAAFTLTRDPERDVNEWLWGIAAPLYLGGLASYLVLLRDIPLIDGPDGWIGLFSSGWTEYPRSEIDFDSTVGRKLLFFTLLTVWATDTGAYAVGRAIGRHKLAPAISPAKTIEGSLGSLVTGFIAVFVLDAALDIGFETQHLVALGLILPPVIAVGDLTESALKRALGVKDSSGLVPGHGGIADRLDSLLFAAPAVYYYLKWIVL